LPKWKARSWLGVYIGHSLVHSGNVPVIYNPLTTHITPQFHSVFDDKFSTVTGSPSNLNDQLFANLYNNATWLHKDEYAEPAEMHFFDTYWSNPPLMKDKSKSRKKKAKHSHSQLGTTQNKPQTHRIPPGDYASSCDLAINENRPQNGEHVSLSNLAPISEQALTSELDSTHDSASIAMHTDNPSRINLIAEPYSLQFHEYKASLGVHAEVYMVQGMDMEDKQDSNVSNTFDQGDNFMSLLTFWQINIISSHGYLHLQ
jgi:hypothetical protein